MKINLNKKIIFILSMLLAFLLLLITQVNAASINLTASSTSVKKGETVTVTAKVNAGSWNLVLKGANQSKPLVGQTNTTDNQSASTSIKFVANTVGSYTFTLTGDITDYYTEETTKGLNKSLTIIVKELPPPPPPKKSSNANLSDLGIKPHDFHSFKPSRTSYFIEVPNDVSSIEIYAKKQDAKASVSGVGKRNLKVGKNSFNVVCTAENGATKTYTLNIKRQTAEETAATMMKSNNALLASLIIEGAELTEKFDANKKEYIVNVSEEIESVKITAKPSDSKAKVSVVGGEKLVIGENIATITVTAEDGTKNTYTIKIMKQSNKLELNTLVVAYINDKMEFIELPITPKFSPEIFDYRIQEIEADVEELKVDALTDRQGVKVEIEGNKNLKEGKNVIKVVLKNADDTERVEYVLVVNRKSKQVETPVGMTKTSNGGFAGTIDTIKDFVSQNKTIIMFSSLVFCIVAMLGLSIYIMVDYRNYKMMAEKLAILTRASRERNKDKIMETGVSSSEETEELQSK